MIFKCDFLLTLDRSKVSKKKITFLFYPILYWFVTINNSDTGISFSTFPFFNIQGIIITDMYERQHKLYCIVLYCIVYFSSVRHG